MKSSLILFHRAAISANEYVAILSYQLHVFFSSVFLLYLQIIVHRFNGFNWRGASPCVGPTSHPCTATRYWWGKTCLRPGKKSAQASTSKTLMSLPLSQLHLFLMPRLKWCIKILNLNIILVCKIRNWASPSYLVNLCS